MNKTQFLKDFSIDIPLPNDWNHFIYKSSRDFNFLFGHKVGKQYEFTCSHCKTTHIVSDVHKMGSYYKCPSCKLNLKYLNDKIAKSQHGREFVSRFDKVNGSVVFRTFVIYTGIHSALDCKQKVYEIQRDIMSYQELSNVALAKKTKITKGMFGVEGGNWGHRVSKTRNWRLNDMTGNWEYDEVFEKEKQIHSDVIAKGIIKASDTLMIYAFQHGDLEIRPVHDIDELVNESKELSHCVRSYDERIANGETGIFVVRKVEEPDRPFVTVELKGRELVQARAKQNKKPPKEVDNFLDQWLKKKVVVNHDSTNLIRA